MSASTDVTPVFGALTAMANAKPPHEPSVQAFKDRLRGLFKVPTGEDDADEEPQNGMPDLLAAKQALADKNAGHQDADLKERGLKLLAVASKRGTPALEAVWKAMPEVMKRACHSSLASFKDEAAKVKEVAHA